MSVLIRRGDSTVTETVSAGCTPATRFQIASVSKQFTAAAVLLLAERGALSLDDPIGRRLDGCPAAWHDITLHHLLSHSSGLGHWPDYPMIDLAGKTTPAELRETFHRVPPLFRPGAGWHYSSPAYVLLAHVVQEVAAQSYQDFLAEEIFAPLGLTGTFAGSPGNRPAIAQGHDTHGDPIGSWELDVVNAGAGDVWSTPADLVAWIDALRAGRLLGEHYRTLMLTEQAPTGQDEEARGYGYGWFVGSLNGNAWFHHSGDNAGYKAFLACVPKLNFRFALLADTDATDPATVRTLLSAALAG